MENKNLRFCSQSVVVGVEFAIVAVEVSNSDVGTDHFGATLRTTDPKGHVLVFIHTGRQPDDNSIQNCLPLHLHATVEQLNARVEFVTLTNACQATFAWILGGLQPNWDKKRVGFNFMQHSKVYFNKLYGVYKE